MQYKSEILQGVKTITYASGLLSGQLSRQRRLRAMLWLYLSPSYSVDMLILPVVLWLLHLFFRKTKWLLRQLVVAGYWLAGARRRVGPRGTTLPGGAQEPGKQMTVHVRESIKIRVHVSHCWRLSESSSTSDDTILHFLLPPIFFFYSFFLLLFTLFYITFLGFTWFLSVRGFSSSSLKRMLTQIYRKTLLSCTGNGLPKNTRILSRHCRSRVLCCHWWRICEALKVCPVPGEFFCGWRGRGETRRFSGLTQRLIPALCITPFRPSVLLCVLACVCGPG
jgi:hypothetical protein